MLRCQGNGSPDTDRPGAASAREVPLDPRLVEVSPEGARAPVEGTPASANDRRCPVCSDPLRSRQRVCSGRCRAELSRRRQAEARQARDQAVRALLIAALDLVGKEGPP
jgi:predicted nucleic acid-binding Zn ribbon protein